MRIALWLAITVFVSTLFWPLLLDDKHIVFCALIFLILLILPRIRILAVIPFMAIYFTLYTNLTLTGTLPLSLPFANSASLQQVVDAQDHSILVQITSLMSAKNSGYFTGKLIELDGLYLNYSPLLEMRWYKPTLFIQAGELHRFRVRFKPVYGRANPAGFDRQKWLYSKHIAYQANIKAHLAEQSAAHSFRSYFYQKVKAVSESLHNQGIILALSFADKSLISLEKKERLKTLAITHLFAISGLHIGLLFSFFYFALHFLFKRLLPYRYLGWNCCRLVNFGALVGAFFYAYLAGFSLPTQRAFLMLLLAVLLLSMKRKCALVDILRMTLFLILLWDPLAVLSLSLWLSFIAVSIILIILWRFQSLMLLQHEANENIRFPAAQRYLKFLLLIQFCLTLLMMPLQLINFSSFNILAPLINFIAVPLFSLLIIPLVLLGCLLALIFEPIAFILFSIADHIITLFFAAFDGAASAYQRYSMIHAELIILLLSLVVVIYAIHFQAANQGLISAVFATLLLGFVLISMYKEKSYDSDAWYVEVLDVGQGLSVLIRSEEETLLYDTGPRYPSGFTTAESEVLPYLHYLGINQLDYLVISHSDIDHAGGFAVINKNFAPKMIIFGEPVAANEGNSKSARLCKRGQKWSLGALSVTVLSPFSVANNNNNNSCVLRISDGYYSLLLTGDIDKKQEFLLLVQAGAQLDSDLLFAPHHGSKHSSSEQFIKRVSPQWVVFTSGFMNHWGFPANEVKLRYKKQSVSMVDSGLSGYIRFTIGKEQIKMQTYREDLASYWYHHSFSI